ncbi:alginate export family protein [Pseudaquidulcibacter saccharophilus]|uniref:alginate export family protein n=1 Tax=Pseudaquidulcibacter saccharophilus TaxID=2831900 RepID=UPI001EFEFD2F|nr:alginate export family protein [Pseudaquidulcibacter saccharophilus]
MKNTKLSLLATVASLIFAAPAMAADNATNLIDAITNGQTHFDARLRYEFVSQDGIANDANATTLRSRLNYQTKRFNGFSGLVEFENVTHIFGNDFNNTINGKTTYATVADPDDTLVNRLYVDYVGLPKTAITLGRQSINLNNQRHVGAGAWRQNDQTFDALSVKNNSLPNTEIYYAYATQVNRVFGTKSPQGVWKDTAIHLLNLSYDAKTFGKISVYDYLLDLPNAAALSTQTFGARYEIVKAHPTFKLGFNAEFANQKDYANNTANVDLNYYSLEPSISFGNWQVKAQYEAKEGNGTRAFQFPLGTNHAFDGWVDKFLTTPANGLVDANIGVSYKAKSPNKLLDGTKFSIVFHDFEAQNGGLKYGTEWNATIEQNFGKNYSAGIKIGKYEADNLFTNTTKIMPYIGLKF